MRMNNESFENLADTHLVCRVCGAELKIISSQHLSTHG